MVAFFGFTLFMVLKNFEYANLYKAERLSVYANELVFAYKATKQDILAKEQQRQEIQHDTKWWSM